MTLYKWRTLFLVILILLTSGPSWAQGAPSASFERTFHIGDPEIRNLGKLRQGNQIGIYLESPVGTHIVTIERKLGSSGWVHSCDAHEQFGTTCAWTDNIDKVGSSAYRYIPGVPHNRAEWLGWTDTADKQQVFTLIIYYEAGP